jgi:ligand-binding sensor protein
LSAEIIITPSTSNTIAFIYYFAGLTSKIAPIIIGRNHSNSFVLGTSFKIKKENIITNIGIVGKLDIATNELSL